MARACCADPVTGDQRIGLTVVSLVCPGFAHAVTGKRITAAILATLGTLPCPLALWFGWPVLAFVAVVRLVAAVLGYLVSRRATAASWGGLAPTAVVLAGLSGLAFLKISLETYRIPSVSMVPTLEVKSSVLVDQLTIRWRKPTRGEVVLFGYPCDPERTYIKRVIALAGDSVEVRCGVVYVNGEAIKSELVKDRDSYVDVDEADGGREIKRDASRYREHHGGHAYEVVHPVDYKATEPDEHDFPAGRDRMPSCHEAEPGDNALVAQARPTGTIVEVTGKRKPCEPQAHYVVPAGSIFVMGDNRNNANDSRVYGAVSLDAVTGRLID